MQNDSRADLCQRPAAGTPTEATKPSTPAAGSRWRRVHRWIGLPAAAFLALVGLTGAVLAFREPLDRVLNRRLTTVVPSGPKLSLNSIVDRLGLA